jgi:cell division protein FtsW
MAMPAVVLVALGLVFANLAASPAVARSGDSLMLSVIKHIAAAGIGFALMFALSRVKYLHLRQASLWVFLAAIIMLMLVRVPGIGHMVNGAYRWIGWGYLRIQPSEFAKLALILYLAAIMTQPGNDVKEGGGLLMALVPIVVVSLLLEVGQDLGTTVVVFLMALSMLFVAGARTKHVYSILGVAVLVGVVMTVTAEHRWHRVLAWLDPASSREASGYQIMESLIAIGENGLLGKGFGAGEARFYVPAADTDYIMATVAEETGLVGVIVVVSLLGLVVWHAHRVACGIPDPFARLVASGIGAMFLWQSLINLAVVTNSIPSTGVPMPFISSGGSSLITCLAALGILSRPVEEPAGAPA